MTPCGKTDNSPDKDIAALADWLDRQHLDELAYYVRDYLKSREGPWKTFTSGIASKLDFVHVAPGTKSALIGLLRTPKSGLSDAIKLL